MSFASGNLRNFLFLFAVLFHLAVYGFYLAPATLITKSAIEPDDAFAYIQKSSALLHCLPLASCPAYVTLLSQARDSGAEKWFADRYTGRIFCNYSPLHSLALAALQRVFGSWERAYAALVILGGVFIAFSFALLIYGIFGLAATSLWLLFFTSVKYRGAGWQYVVPANISAGLAALSWYFLLSGKAREASLRSRLLGALFAGLAVLAHPIGVAYAGVSLLLVLYSSFRERKIEWRGLVPLVASVGLAKFSVGLLQVHGLECSFGSRLGFDLQNFSMAARVAAQWLVQQPGIPFAVLFIFLALRALAPGVKQEVALLLSALAALFCVSVFHILPGYPGELAMRVSLPLGLLLSGGVMAGGLAFVQLCMQARRKVEAGKSSGKKILASVLLVAVLLDGARVMVVGLAGPESSWLSLRFWQKAITRSPELYWEKSQVDTVLKLTNASSLIAFENETTMYHALANGLHARRLVFLPYASPAAVTGTPSHFVLTSPIQPVLLGSSPLEIHRGPGQVRSSVSLELYLENRTFHSARVRIINGVSEKHVELSPWQELMVPADSGDSGSTPVSISISESTGARVVLRGFNAGQEKALSWPWDAGFELRYGGKAYPIQSVTGTCGKNCKVVADGGYSVVVLPGEGSR